MRRFVALALFLPLPAFSANPFMTDASDLWWNPAESGWGVNIIEQSNILFATFFVYSPDGRAHWYVASDMECPNTPADAQMICQGALFETTGPVVGPGFDPNAVIRRQVGDAKFFYSRSTGGQFDFTIDGVTTSKSVTRQTWAVNDINGMYNAARVTHAQNGCADPGVTATQPLGTMTVSQSGSGATITTHLDTPAYTCTYSGSFSQSGRFGAVSGNFTCSDGTSGPFNLTGIEVSQQGFLGHIEQVSGGCAMVGNLGGTRTTVTNLSE